jgi:bifunctional non-homologous end joining protein LigD
MKNITLYCKEGSSDKVYQAAIEPSGHGYVVTFAYGRRGATLQTGTKTHEPVSFNDAERIYDKLVRGKLAKGYTPGVSGTPFQHTEKQVSGVRCQLLNPVGEERLPELLNGFDHWMQPKIDGVRCLIQKQGTEIRGINRLGLFVSLPANIIAECQHYDLDFLIDGEIVGDIYHVFDLLEHGGDDFRSKCFGERYLGLLNLLESFGHPSIEMVETAVLPKAKHELYNRLRLQEQEGVVFKEVNAVFAPGRNASGGPQLKYKFVESASFLVGKINLKRSVSLLLLDCDKLVNVGNVTIPPNHEIPAPMSIVDVRYLYAFKGGSVFQPVYLGERQDLTKDDCPLDQLKFKPEPQPLAA